MGAYLGALFFVLFPVFLNHIADGLFAGIIDAGHLENLQKVIFGGLIIFFLIREPDGLARLWQRCRLRIRLGPLVS